MSNYKIGREASQILGVHQRTLYQWEKKGWIHTIRTLGNTRLYDVSSCIKKDLSEGENGKLNIVYVRVSSAGQKDDLERQTELIYPNHMLIQDVGSGLNFKRKGIRKLIKLAIGGRVNEVVVAHKDRLTRIGFDLLEFIIKEYSNGQIIVLDNSKDNPQDELMKDMLQLMNCFVAKMNGLRRYSLKQDEVEDVT